MTGTGLRKNDRVIYRRRRRGGMRPVEEIEATILDVTAAGNYVIGYPRDARYVMTIAMAASVRPL